MSIIQKLKHGKEVITKKANSVKTFMKEPFLWAGMASFSSMVACVYGDAYVEDPMVCHDPNSERACIDQYVRVCAMSEPEGDDVYVVGRGPRYYAYECEEGCDNGKCINGRVKNEKVTNCSTGESSKSDDGQRQICIDGIWFIDKSNSFSD